MAGKGGRRVSFTPVPHPSRPEATTLGWGIILGSIPVAAVGLLLKDFIEVTARSMWVIAGALIIWSAVMWFADEHSDGPVGATHASTGKGMSEVKVAATNFAASLNPFELSRLNSTVTVLVPLYLVIAEVPSMLERVAISPILT